MKLWVCNDKCRAQRQELASNKVDLTAERFINATFKLSDENWHLKVFDEKQFESLWS